MLVSWFVVSLALATDPVEETVAAEPDERRAQFVAAGAAGLYFGLSPVPSASLAVFLGASVPVRMARASHWVALGYEGGLGLGGADDVWWMGEARETFVSHRHGFAVRGAAGRKGRLLYGAGIGGVFVDRRVGVDFDVKVGALVGRRGARVHGIVGGQLRVVVVPNWTAWPTVGLFAGVGRGAVGNGAVDRDQTPPHGVGSLVTGAVLVAFGLGVAIGEGVVRARGGGPESFFWAIGGWASVAAGAPMLAVGGVRHHRYRAWRAQVGASAGGVAIRF